MYTPAVPRVGQILRGGYATANKSVVWLPDSVVSEGHTGPDLIRPYFRWGTELIEMDFKSVSYPAIDPEETGDAYWPLKKYNVRLSSDGNTLHY